MDAAYYSRTEAFVLQLNLVVTLDTSALLEVVVESLDLDCGQFLQFDTADAGDDVVVDVVLVVQFCVRTEPGFGVDLVPGGEPRCHCVVVRFGDIQLLTVSDGLCQFLLDLCLGLAQDILGNPLAGSWVVGCRVSTLPAAILPFADVPFSICSAFCHCAAPPFSDTQYRMLASISSAGRQSYQFVINLEGFYSYISPVLWGGHQPSPHCLSTQRRNLSFGMMIRLPTFMDGNSLLCVSL